MREAINLYLRICNAYSAARDLLLFSLGSPESIFECSAIVENVFRKLIGIERWCKILVDEIHINPGVQYQGGGGGI